MAFSVLDRTAHRVVSVFGDIDIASADAFEIACRESSDRRIVVDLLACPYMDSTGLTALVRASQGNALTVVLAPSSRIYRIFAITDLLHYFNVVDTMEKALDLRPAQDAARTMGAGSADRLASSL